MKPTLPLFSLSLLFLSCFPAVRNYYTVAGTNIEAQPDRPFRWENDTVRIEYDFNGYGGPVHITLTNLMNDILSVDWEKSALIINGSAYSLYVRDRYARWRPEPDTNFRNYPGWDPYRSDASIYALHQGPVQYIPPHASVERIVAHLMRQPLGYLPWKEGWERENWEGKTFHTKKLPFDPMGSPLNFRAYLRFRAGGDNGAEFAADHGFYVSEIWRISGQSLAPEGLRKVPYRFQY